MAFFLVVAAVAAVDNFGGTTPTAYHAPIAAAVTGNAQLVQNAAATGATEQATSVPPPAATAPPAPAPPSLSGAAPLRPHEVFGFAPYWTLSQSSGFNVTGISTIAYFSLGVNSDGTLAESGPGWSGYQSQALATLITRAHGAGDRVVLTVNNFDQNALNALTSSPSAPGTLATALIGAIRAKNLDGVNLDFEGSGAGDQAGLTNLVTTVSTAIHAVDPHYQVTMDTYASSAGDPNGFYDIPALAPAVDAFFVMEYSPNLQSSASSESPLTSTLFNDQTAVHQYAAVVPASKVILGLPFFGIDWPTSDGTLTAKATGPVTNPSYGQILASGHPIYWDSTTDSAWTSYQVGAQWHETFFEDPTSLYDAAKLASASDLGGVGAWALGMDGNDPNMLSALLGFSPAVKTGSPGPSSTSSSPTSSTSTTSTTSTTSVPPGFSISTGIPEPLPDPPGTPSTSSPTSSTSTTTPSDSPTSTSTTTAAGDAADYQFGGTWNGHRVDLSPVPSAAASTYVAGPSAGPLTLFATSDPAYSCVASDTDLTVRHIEGTTDQYEVVTQAPTDCLSATFIFTWS
jgi:spore germination protein YaaH